MITSQGLGKGVISTGNWDLERCDLHSDLPCCDLQLGTLLKESQGVRDVSFLFPARSVSVIAVGLKERAICSCLVATSQ
jgi:hypothetical protein